MEKTQREKSDFSQLTVKISKDLHTQLKVLAAMNNTSIAELVTGALERELEATQARAADLVYKTNPLLALIKENE